jgi:hypothetical protein
MSNQTNNPDKSDELQHGDTDELKNLHEKNERRSCFWKHPVRAPWDKQTTPATASSLTRANTTRILVTTR